MEQGIVYPPPLPNPVFKLTREDWSELESRSSTRISPATRRFITYHCNYYIISICRFRENNDRARATRKIMKKFSAAMEFVEFLDDVRRVNGPLQVPTHLDEKFAKGFLLINHFTTSYMAEADSILDEEYAALCGLPCAQYPLRTARRAFRSHVDFQEVCQTIKDALVNLNEHLNSVSQKFSVSEQFHGDPFIDELTIRLWVSFGRSGGSHKYTEECFAFIGFIYEKMVTYYFSYFRKSVYASIYRFDADAVSNRLKRATTNLSQQRIEALDNIELFEMSETRGPENIQAGRFRLSLIGLD